MAIATVVQHSKLSKVKLDSSGGVLTDISDAVDKVSFSQSLEQGEITTFGSNFKQWLAGYSDGKIKMSGPWSRGLDQFMTALQTAFINGTIASASLEYGPEGTDAGDVKKACEVILTDYNGDSASKDPVKWDAEFMITGAVTIGTY
jgi:hypothetical protein